VFNDCKKITTTTTQHNVSAVKPNARPSVTDDISAHAASEQSEDHAV